jgi:hypothetical protein
MWVNGENKLFNPALMWDKIIEEGMWISVQNSE